MLAGVTADQARVLGNLCIYTRHDLCIRRRPVPMPGSARLTSGDDAVRCQESCMPAVAGRRRVYSDEAGQSDRTFNANRL